MPREVGPAYHRHEFPIAMIDSVTGTFDGTGAINLVDTIKPGYKCMVEKIRYQSALVHTGAGGTQTFKLRKGGTSGTVIATLTVALADVNAVGKFKEASVASADAENAKLNDADGLSLTRESGGTAYTAASGLFTIVLAQKPQARI